ncbi:Multiple RNA-binding domain-containing protein 1 [Vitis vinifera]|uniref:Multiple RNA-binding domain-containing protein 1 n=1 Tax=Vitis vinifera TaxID=29760 RepID=A0A438J1G3_VITVI|nr:Multiple RNA-binding domain-containing protein 1 [Vitis vinifera]
MGWVISGSEVRRSMRMRRERDSRGGFARNDASTRRMAVGSWFEEQRRGMRRLIFVSSSGVKSICFFAAAAAATSAAAEEEEEEEEERVENRREIGLRGGREQRRRDYVAVQPLPRRRRSSRNATANKAPLSPPPNFRPPPTPRFTLNQGKIEGKSRQFAFIGFRTEQEAEEALKFFNNSYLDTCRITCEIARKVGDPDIPRPWSRYSLKKEINQLNDKQTQSMREGRDEAVQMQADLDESDEREDEVKKKWSDSESDDVSESGDDSESDDDSESGDDNDDNIDSFNKKSVESQDVQQVCQHGQHNTIKNDVAQEKVDDEDHSEESDGERMDSGNPLLSSKDGKDVLETGRLFVRNLPYTATEDELEELFSKFGNVSQVHLVVNKDTKRSKGIAYVLFTLPESAVRSWDAIRAPSLAFSLSFSVSRANASASQSSKTLKQKREEEKKASEASGDTRAWNSLFMRTDTVVENIARKYGISKSDLLDSQADDLAVRIALGETQVIAETKKALINAGVNIASLEEFVAGKTEGAKRSNHILLVKNLPYGSSEGELAKMFGKYGSLDKIILPPTKTLALVVFLEPAEARAAFRGLAYKRYK